MFHTECRLDKLDRAFGGPQRDMVSGSRVREPDTGNQHVRFDGRRGFGAYPNQRQRRSCSALPTSTAASSVVDHTFAPEAVAPATYNAQKYPKSEPLTCKV